jgi:hypothetical protein
VDFDADPATETGLVKVVNGEKEILFDDTQSRSATVKAGDTLTLRSYAEDWKTSTTYKVKVVAG